jgi:hypothetical protein
MLLLATLAALAISEAAGILAKASGADLFGAVWAGCIAFGSTLITMLSIISFLSTGSPE